jgi:integrase
MVLGKLEADRRRAVGDRDLETWGEARLPRKTSVDSRCSTRLDAKMYNKISSHERTYSGLDGEESGRSCERAKFPSILQPFFHCAQKRRRKMESDPGFEGIKSKDKKRKVQNGNSRTHTRTIAERRMGKFNRSHRSIPPHSSSKTTQEIFPFRVQWNGLSVQGSTNGPDVITQDIHKNYQGDTALLASEDNQGASVFGRLAHSRAQLLLSKGTNRDSSTVNTRTGLSDESREIGTRAKVSFHFPRLSVSAGGRYSSTDGGSMGKDSRKSETIPSEIGDISAGVDVADRGAHGNREIGTTGDAENENNTNGVIESVVPILRRSRTKTSDQGSRERGSELVDEERECDGRSTISSKSSATSCVHRCQQRWMGWSLEQQHHSGQVERGRETVPHQRARVTGGVEGTGAVGEELARYQCHDSNGQFHDNGIHKETRRNKIEGIARNDNEVLRLAGRESDHGEVQAHTGQTECVSRPAVKSGTGHTNRMVNSPHNPGISVGEMGETHGGFICDKRQSQASMLCVTDPGSKSNGGGCIINQLGQHDSVCISTHGDHSESVTEDAATQVQNDPPGSSVASTKMVSSPAQSTNGRSVKPAPVVKAAETAKVRIISSTSRGVPATRLEIIEQGKRSRGFSESVATRMARAQKASSQKVYDGKWRVFVDWCEGRGEDPLTATLPLVADFFCYLHEERKLALRTIEGYRTAIGHTLRAAGGCDFSQDREISELFGNFARERGINRTTVAPWDLALVLLSLTKAPYEPMISAELKHVTLKTVFLLALASGKRRSEIHALTKDVSHSEGWGSITIPADPEFLSKTQLASQGAEMVNAVTIKALTKELSADMQEDRSLCVVRAVRHYLHRTENIRGSRKRLFIAHKQGVKRDIHMNTISSWIKSVVASAYENSTEEQRRVTGVKAHQVRAMAASCAFYANSSLNTIMSACSWKNATTFTAFYLKDVAMIKDKMYHLGPVVAASQTIN